MALTKRQMEALEDAAAGKLLRVAPDSVNPMKGGETPGQRRARREAQAGKKVWNPLKRTFE
jgi:hypothetical protein